MKLIGHYLKSVFGKINLFSLQYLLGKNTHGLLLTEYYHGQRQKSKVLKGRVAVDK